MWPTCIRAIGDGAVKLWTRNLLSRGGALPFGDLVKGQPAYLLHIYVCICVDTIYTLSRNNYKLRYARLMLPEARTRHLNIIYGSQYKSVDSRQSTLDSGLLVVVGWSDCNILNLSVFLVLAVTPLPWAVIKNKTNSHARRPKLIRGEMPQRAMNGNG